MIIETLSVFPEVFESYMNASMMGRAQREGIIDFHAYDLRDWTHDRHRSVDDEPYGGGQGMLMKCAPVFEAYDELADKYAAPPYTVFFTPAGEPFTQEMAEEFSQLDRILFVCGRYEGFDERVYSLADRRVSLGDYVLTGGELPALVVTDAVVRLLPGVLGNEASFVEESFSEVGLLEFSQYTRPAEYRGMKVPDVLLSGNHKEVDKWRRNNAIAKTLQMRPDLIGDAQLTEEERARIEAGTFQIDE